MGIADELKNIVGKTPEVTDVEREDSSGPTVEEEPPMTVMEPSGEENKLGPEANANVKLAGQGQALNEGTVIIGRVKMKLPSVAQQRAGFYLDDPVKVGELLGQYPQYKRLKAKGDKQSATNVSLT